MEKASYQLPRIRAVPLQFSWPERMPRVKEPQLSNVECHNGKNDSFQISDPELDCNQLDADINKLIVHDQWGSIMISQDLSLYYITYIPVYMYA